MTRPRSSLINVFIAFVVLIVSCEGREQLTGKYQADTNNRQSHTILLELMADGRGSWSIAWHVLLDCALADLDVQLEQLAANALRAPQVVFPGHLKMSAMVSGGDTRLALFLP